MRSMNDKRVVHLGMSVVDVLICMLMLHHFQDLLLEKIQ